MHERVNSFYLLTIFTKEAPLQMGPKYPFAEYAQI